MTRRPPPSTGEPAEPDTRTRAVAEAISVPLVLVPVIMIVGHVVVGQWRAEVEPLALWVLFVADGALGVIMLICRLRRITREEGAGHDDAVDW